ncbi:Integral membrane protein (fragment) [Legionella fallonii LLAP-10]|uniref:Integral membrane protein n=2 Tax=Legionella fallonii TaxID=96230 RepID=A0A098G9F8_9GAMM
MKLSITTIVAKLASLETNGLVVICMNIKSGLLNLLKNPNLYIAAVGTIPGVVTGGIIGILSGCYIAPLFGLFSGYKDHQFGIDVDLLTGGAFGLIIGVILGEH